ncbi:MAG: hypothetical protein HY000_15815, partial [Planctomycetes bacterium]|nr:hypothetical protein [Planctomycetota bacterium]
MSNPDVTSADLRSTTSGRGKRPKRVLRVNLRLLAALLAILALAAPAIYFWRAHQVRRNANAMLQQAEQLEKKNDWSSAVTWYFRYLQLAPEDNHTQIRLAEAFDKSARRPAQKHRAVELYARAIASNATHDRIRELYRRQAELLLEVGRFDEAEDRARWLLDHPAEPVPIGNAGQPSRAGLDPVALRLMAKALDGQLRQRANVDVAKVIDALKVALEHNPGDVELTLALVRSYRDARVVIPDLDRPARHKLADQAIDRMVELNPGDVASRLARYRCRVFYGLSGADEDLTAAQQLAPDNSDVLLLSADAALRSRDYSKARDYCQKLVNVAPGDRRGYELLVQTYLNMGASKEAIGACEQGLARMGEHDLDLDLLLVQALINEGRLDEAGKTLTAMESIARKLGPDLSAPERRRVIEALEVAKAQLALASGRAAAAIDILRRTAAGHTAGSDVERDANEQTRRWLLLGDAYAQIDQWDLAATAYDDAAAVDVNAAGL